MMSSINEIVTSACSNAVSYYRKRHFKRMQAGCVVRNGSILGDYLLAALAQLVKKIEDTEEIALYADTGDLSFNRSILDEETDVKGTDPQSFSNEGMCFFVVNCLDERFSGETARSEVISSLNDWCTLYKEAAGMLVCCVIVPQADSCPDGVTKLAEREYDSWLALKENHTWQEGFYLEIEKTIRTHVRENACSAGLLRTDNVIGPECLDLVQGMDMAGVFREARDDSSVSIEPGDAKDSFTLLGVEHFLTAALTIAGMRRTTLGNIYNVSGDAVTAMSVKQALHKLFPDRLKLNSYEIEPYKMVYHGMDCLKLRHLSWRKNWKTIPELCYRTACYEFGIPYDMNRKLGVYNGRLDELKHLELEMLKEIDRVCRENDIQYFLAGGSCLGAVRHQDVIPWDDDIDIGMLREDYERFRRICPEKLSDKYTYEDANGSNGSHYHFDKVRLKNTFLSTNYSAHFDINDGVFIDVLVYDRTSNIPVFQKIHIKLTAVWTRVINIKWWDRPRKKVHYRLSRIALPVMRLINWNWFHKMFDRITRFYEKKKNAEYVIDTMGQNIKKGAMRLDWMTDVQYVPFADMYAPIPTGYHEYLTHLYGEHYMQYLPVDRRVSGHKLARVDLGGYLFHETADLNREVDIRGELFESEA